MKQITLTLTKTNWWNQINDDPNISDLSKSKLLSALGSFTTPSTPPALTASLKKGEFEKIVSEFKEITLDMKEMFLVCEVHPEVSRIRITDKMSPNWNESIWIPGEECDEGFPKSEESIYLIRTRNNDIYYAKVDKSNQKKEGTKWQTLEGKIISPKIVTGWFKLC